MNAALTTVPAANVSDYDALYIVAVGFVVKLSVAQETAYAALIAERPASAVDFLLGVLSQQTRYAKPRVTVSEGSVTVRFCDAYTFTIEQADGSDFRSPKGTWLVSRTDIVDGWTLLDVRGQQTREQAYEFARASLIAPAAWGTVEQVHALAVQCERDRGLLVKTIKRIAKERFGVKLSVRGDRGTAYGWVSICYSDRKSTLPAEELAVMHALNGYYTTNSASVSTRRGERIATICNLAGQPWPEGHTVDVRDWD